MTLRYGNVRGRLVATWVQMHGFIDMDRLRPEFVQDTIGLAGIVHTV